MKCEIGTSSAHSDRSSTVAYDRLQAEEQYSARINTKAPSEREEEEARRFSEVLCACRLKPLAVESSGRVWQG